jgi:hypothetical protein
MLQGDGVNNLITFSGKLIRFEDFHKFTKAKKKTE